MKCSENYMPNQSLNNFLEHMWRENIMLISFNDYWNKRPSPVQEMGLSCCQNSNRNQFFRIYKLLESKR